MKSAANKVVQHPSSTPEARMKQAKTQGASGTSEVPDWSSTKLKKLEPNFAQMIFERNQLKLTIDRAETRLSGPMEKGKRRGGGLNDEIKVALLTAGLQKVQVENQKVKIQTGRTASYIDGLKLLEHGVDADVIKACTVPGDEYEYVIVTTDKEE